MKKQCLGFMEGDESVKPLLDQGRSVVYFLTNPFTPCIVHREEIDDVYLDDGIAINLGKLQGEFASWIGESPLSRQEKFFVPYLADEKVVLYMPRGYTTPHNPGKHWNYPGFCRLNYGGVVEDILSEFENEGYHVLDLRNNGVAAIEKKIELQRQALKNRERIQERIDAHYEMR